MKLSKIAFRNMSRNRRRTIMSAIAIALATFCFVFLFSLIGGMEKEMRENIQDFYTGEIQIRNPLYTENEHLFPLFYGIENASQVLKEIEAQRDWAAASPRITFPAALYTETENLSALGQGVDFTREEGFQNLNKYLVSGRLPEMGKDEILITPKMALDTGAREGDALTFFTQTRSRGSNGFTMTVAGIVKYPVVSMNDMLFLAPLDRIQYFLRMGDSVTEILLKTTERTAGFGQPADNSREAAEELGGLFRTRGWDNITAFSWLDLGTTYDLLATAQSIYSFLAILFFLLGSTVIANTTMMVIFERTREIGALAALGMEGRQIVKMFFLEAFFIALVGAAIGLVLGIALVLPLTFTGLNMGGAMEGISLEVSSSIQMVLSWRSTILVFVLSTAVASLVSFFPSRKAARIQPVEALRAE